MRSGIEVGVRRLAEVLLGCIVGLAVAWLLSAVWPMPDTKSKAP